MAASPGRDRLACSRRRTDARAAGAYNVNVPGWLELLLRSFPEEFREAHRRELEEFVSAELSQAGRERPWVALLGAFAVTAGVHPVEVLRSN